MAVQDGLRRATQAHTFRGRSRGVGWGKAGKGCEVQLQIPVVPPASLSFPLASERRRDELDTAFQQHDAPSCGVVQRHAEDHQVPAWVLHLRHDVEY